MDNSKQPIHPTSFSSSDPSVYELNQLKSRFLTMASHEFRTPLSTILSSLSLIEQYHEKGLYEKAEKHFSRIKDSIHHLTETLDDFMSLTSLEKGEVILTPRLFNLQTFCEDFISENQALLKKGQTLRHKFPKTDIDIFQDKKILKHLIFNLFSNAIKYSKEGQTISCQVHVTTDQLIISIIDQGIGIPAEDQKFLFSRFFRGSNAINITGTGIGLNIVKKYLDIMGGKISFHSLENKGSTFTVTIPTSLPGKDDIN